MSNTPSAQQGGTATPIQQQGQQQGQSGSAPSQQQQGGTPIFRDWAAI